MTEIIQDLRYTLRNLRRDFGFTAVAILILALGIGANTAVFSVVNAVLLRPLPFRDPGRLVWIAGGTAEDTGQSAITYEVLAFEEFRRANRSFENLTAYFAFFGYLDYKLTGYGEPERLVGLDVAENLFPMLGVQPALGRLFLPQECQLNGPRAVLLSHGFWRRRFGSDPGVIGRKLTLNDQAVTIVGVMPAESDFASIFTPGAKVDIYVPAVMDRMRNWGNTLAIIGRLKPGVSVEQARTDFGIFLPQLNKMHHGWGAGYRARLMPLDQYVSGRMRRPLIVLWCAVGVVMLIVCTNLSNLLLARAASRTKEFAVRSAMGAGRVRLVRQLLTESLVLSGAGAALGLGLAYALTRQLARTAAVAMPLLNRVGIDGAALGFTGLVAVVSAVLFGLVPALRLSNANLRDALADSGRGSSEGKGHGRIRAGLVVAEIGLACTLLVGAGLLLRSFYELLSVNLGFQPSRAAALRIDYSNRGTPEQIIAFLDEVARRARAVPGIESAGFTDALPLDRNRSWRIGAKGKVYQGGETPSTFVYVVGSGYLDAMGIRLIAGRKIDERDTAKSEPVVVINQTAARGLWPGEDAVGRIAQVNGRDVRVAGVVGDVRHSSLEDEAGFEIYLPFAQAPPASAELVLRTKLPPAAMGRAVRAALREVDPNMPASDFRPLQQFVDRAVSPRRFFTSLLSGFAGLALVLASLGIYGVISYSVTQRTQEIGIRMALGASPAQVRMSVLGSTMRLAAVGIALGGLAAVAATRLIGSMLYGVGAGDVYTFVAMVAVLGAVALAAGYFPARRASRTDPISALRAS